MKQILQKLIEHQTLTSDEAKEILLNITEEKYNEHQVSAFITVFLMRSITPQELCGFREALMQICHKIDLGGIQSIDVCGTGGDGKDTFNISTLSAFVVAGAGYKVTKHGNKSVSSKCGSSDVLESLGYQFSNEQDRLLKEVDQANICFMHAPLFHSALKSVGPIRRNLGIKTFFNMLGPLVNPASPSHQFVGVFNLQVMRLYHSIFSSGDQQYTIVHGLSGFDEISLTDETKVISSNGGTSIFKPENLGLPRYKVEELFGGNTIEEAKKIFIDVLNNDSPEAHKNVVLANSAFAIDCFKSESNLEESFNEAKESLESGAAAQTLKKLIHLN